MDILTIGAKVAVYYVPFLFALCFHEWAHGMVARMRGDNTAEMMGRLTLNPIAHMDMIGTVALPLFAIVTGIPTFFGWAKPVPVNNRNLKRPRIDLFWIALAGPLSNVFLAVVATLIIGIIARQFAHIPIMRDSIYVLNIFIMTNLFLAIFNLIPIHPLDGGKVLARFLPDSLNRKLEENEQVLSLVLFALIMTGALRILAQPVMYVHDLLIQYALGGLS
jgi:Zn-dependent protease